METVYVLLLGEGVPVYRPVPASKVGSNIFVLGGADLHDPKNEQWQFLPGARVIIEEQMREGRSILVAVTNAPSP